MLSTHMKEHDVECILFFLNHLILEKKLCVYFFHARQSSHDSGVFILMFGRLYLA